MPVWKGDFFWSILKSDKPLSPLSPLSSLSLSLSISLHPRDFKRFSRPVLWSANSSWLSCVVVRSGPGGPGPVPCCRRRVRRDTKIVAKLKLGCLDDASF